MALPPRSADTLFGNTDCPSPAPSWRPRARGALGPLLGPLPHQLRRPADPRPPHVLQPSGARCLVWLQRPRRRPPAAHRRRRRRQQHPHLAQHQRRCQRALLRPAAAPRRRRLRRRPACPARHQHSSSVEGMTAPAAALRRCVRLCVRAGRQPRQRETLCQAQPNEQKPCRCAWCSVPGAGSLKQTACM